MGLNSALPDSRAHILRGAQYSTLTDSRACPIEDHHPKVTINYHFLNIYLMTDEGFNKLI